MKRVSVLVVSSVLFAVSGSSVEAAQVASRDGCVNLRSQPSINAGVIRCLPPGTNLEPYRSPGSGRFTWQKEGDRLWYYTSVPGTSEKGWIMPDCTDITGINKGVCPDTGAAIPLAKPQEPQIVAQAGQQEEVLQNTNWQVVPGARIGKNPADTLLNLNGINRTNNSVTFDITGYQGSYYRLQGDCGTRQVSIIRRGLQTSANDVRNRALRVRYQPVAGGDSNRVTPWHQTILDFACRQPGTQIASLPAGGSTQAVGTVQCRGIMRGSPVDSNPIQKATLEPIAGGYIFRFTEVVQGQPHERVWNLDNLLLVKNVRSYDPDQSITPIKIQSTGAFSKTIMPSSREECTFAGTLQFIGNAYAQLFSGSSSQATLPNSLESTPSPTQSTTTTPQDFYDVPLTSVISQPNRCDSYHFSDLRRIGVGKSLTCKCRPGVPMGVVSGTDVYGDSSEICRSAIHAGKIEKMPDGATITIEIVPSQYTKGTERHGIASHSNYLSHEGKSFVFKEVVADRLSDELRIARRIAQYLTKDDSWRRGLRPCPCYLEGAQDEQNGLKDSTYRGTQKFHPGAEYEFRTRKDRVYEYSLQLRPGSIKIMPGQQCTYATDTTSPERPVRLITDGAGAGTPDAYSPEISLLFHIDWDVQTFKADGMTWEEYQETWKPNKGDSCKTFIVPKLPTTPTYLP